MALQRHTVPTIQKVSVNLEQNDPTVQQIPVGLQIPSWLDIPEEKTTAQRPKGFIARIKYMSWQRWFDLVLAISSFLIAAIYPFAHWMDGWQISWIAGGVLSLIFCITGVTEKLDMWGKKTARAIFISTALKR